MSKPLLPSKKHCVEILRKIGIFNTDGQFPTLEKYISRQQISDILTAAENNASREESIVSPNCILLSSKISDLRRNNGDCSGSPDEITIKEFISSNHPQEKEVLRMATFALLGMAIETIRKK